MSHSTPISHCRETAFTTIAVHNHTEHQFLLLYPTSSLVRCWLSREGRPTRCPVSRAAWPRQTRSEALGRACGRQKAQLRQSAGSFAHHDPYFGLLVVQRAKCRGDGNIGVSAHAWPMPRALHPFAPCRWLPLALRPWGIAKPETPSCFVCQELRPLRGRRSEFQSG